MSSASTPSAASSPAPQPLKPLPAIVRPPSREPRRGRWWLAFFLVAAAGIGLYLKLAPQKAISGKGGATVTRTGGVIVGDVIRSIRISGTIQAERFAAIMAPQLRGSRSDRYRSYSGGGSSGGGGGGGSATPTAPTSTSSSGSSSDNSSGFTGSSQSASGTGTGTSGSTGTSSIGATRGTTNRFSDMAGSSTKGGAGATRGTTSTSVTSTDLGSTGNALRNFSGGPPGGGGGSFGGDFTFVLMKCAPGGTHVKAGDVVAEFDRQYQLNRLDDYKASVVQYEANIVKMKADQTVKRDAQDRLVANAKADWEKTKLDLQTITVRSAIEAEDFKLAEQEAAAHYKEIAAEAADFETSLKADLRRAELDRDQAKIELQRAQNGVDRMIMKAPIDGVVVMQTIFRGGDFGQVQQGDQISAGVVFMTIVDPKSMVLNATVNQVDSEEIRAGMKANVRLDAYPDVSLQASVTAVGAMTDGGGWRANWVRSVPIRLKLNNIDPRVIPDLSGSADVVLSEEKEAVMAPIESIFQDTPNGRPFAYVEAPTGFEKRDVQLGLASNVAVVVRSGLRKGEVVALARPASATPEPRRTP
jgi:HlyD family secretion protein